MPKYYKITKHCHTKEQSTQGTGDEMYNNEMFWELNWLNQWDPRLIKFIKKKILLSPPKVENHLNLNIGFDENQPWKHQGQNDEGLFVEYLHDLINHNISKQKNRYIS